MKEMWNDIPGYEGLYQASNLGKIRSLDHTTIVNCRDGSVRIRHVKGRIIKPSKRNAYGHIGVCLVIDGKQKTMDVHTLVMLTFVGPRPKGLVIRHLNDEPSDNQLTNLSYGTPKQNIIDAYTNGSKTKKFDISNVLEIKKLLKGGMKNTDIAWLYGVGKDTISDIKCGRSFGWLSKEGEINENTRY